MYDPMRGYISGPAISRLTGTHRMTVNDRLRAGAYGQTFRRGRIVFADIEAVEDFHGVPFTDEQLATATGGLPDRLLIMSPPETKTEEAA
jgi:hypothetical protein